MKLLRHFRSIFERVFAGKTGSLFPVESEIDSYHSRAYPEEFLETIEKLVLTTPDLSQALKRSIQLGNTGHITLAENAKGDDTAASSAVSELAESMYQDGPGADGLVNALWRQIMIKGALSLEIVPRLDLSGVEKVVLVSVETVRFRYIDGERVMVQNKGGAEYVLNPAQYIYYPLFTDEKSPYGIPPFISALEAVETQKDSVGSIKRIIRKYGLLGFIFAKLKIPYRGNESENEYQDRLKRKLTDFAKSFRANFESGAAVAYDDTEVAHHSVTNDARGAIELFREIEQQVASGIDIDPALLGRSYSTTETYAGVVYSAFLAQNRNVRRLIKRALEKIYKTHLAMSGYNVRSLKVRFHPDPSLNPKLEAESEGIKIDNVIKKINAGLIDRDTGARELGYEKASGEVRQAALIDPDDLIRLADEKKKPAMYRLK
jgi:hypothetical protein